MNQWMPFTHTHTHTHACTHARTHTNTHTHTVIHYEQFNLFNSPNSHVFGLWEKPEYLEKTHTNSGRTCKLFKKMPTDPVRIQNNALLDVRRQC